MTLSGEDSVWIGGLIGGLDGVDDSISMIFSPTSMLVSLRKSFLLRKIKKMNQELSIFYGMGYFFAAIVWLFAMKNFWRESFEVKSFSLSVALILMATSAMMATVFGILYLCGTFTVGAAIPSKIFTSMIIVNVASSIFLVIYLVKHG